MAIYHLHAAFVQRSRGHSAVAAAAYRAGEKLRDRQEGMTHDYSRKHGVVRSEILAPDHAPEWVNNREELWNRAELAEKRRDGQPAREIRVALPSELTDEQRANLVFAFCKEAFVSRGMIADIAIHRPDRHGDERNHHAHILLTLRELDGDAFAARKKRDWSRVETLQGWREQWAQCQNRALEEAGYSTRVDHRTLEAQGIDREPTTHVGKAATAMERRGEQSERGDKKRRVDTQSQTIDRLKSELAEIDAAIEALSFPPASPPPVAEIQPGQIEQPVLNWEEPNTAAQGLFHDAIVKSYSDATQPADYVFSSPTTLSWEKWVERAFKGSGEQKQERQEEQTDLSRDQLGMKVQSVFRSPVVESYSRMIQQAGEVKEYGLGRSWYDRTVAFFENIYYNTIRYAKTGIQKYTGRWIAPTIDLETDR